MQLYYIRDGQRIGPIERPQFVHQVNQGVIDGSTMVWHDGMANWMTYSEAYSSIFADHLSQAPFPAQPEAQPNQAPTPKVTTPQTPYAGSATTPPFNPQPNTTPPIQQTTTSQPFVDPLELSEDEKRIKPGPIHQFLSFVTIHSKIIGIIAVAACVLFAAQYARKNSRQWMDDATNMKVVKWDQGAAKKNLKKASPYFKKAGQQLAKRDDQKAINTFKEGWVYVEANYYRNGGESFDGNKSFKDAVNESLEPLNQQLDKVFREMLSKYTIGDFHYSDVYTFTERFNRIPNNRLTTIYNEKIKEIDIERAKIAGTLIRIESGIEHETIREVIDQRVTNSLSLPYGFEVTYGAPAGPAEAAATFMNINPAVQYHYRDYHYENHQGKDVMVPTPEDSYRKPELALLYGVTIQLFKPSELTRLKTRGVETNWTAFNNKKIQFELPAEIRLPDDVQVIERKIKLEKIAKQYEEELAMKIANEFALPNLMIHSSQVQLAY